MAEALWVQTLGVDYSAAEDRRLIWTMATPGISRGLQIQTVSGLQVKVTSGAAVIDAGDSTGYVGYMTGDTTLTLSASSSPVIYMVVDPTTAATTISAAGSPPANPYLALGTVVTGGSTVTSISQTSARAVPPGLSGTVLPITGGTLTGALTAPSLTVSGQFVANASGVSAPHGVLLGGATTPTARHYARVSRTNSFTGVVTNTWTSITFGTNDAIASDYGVTAHSTSTNSQRLVCGAAGDYALGGSATFAQPGNNIGTRRSRVVHYNSAGTAVHIAVCSTVDVTTNVSTYLGLNWNCNMFAAKNDWFEFQVWQNQGNNEPLDVGTGAAQDKIWASMRLIQAD